MAHGAGGKATQDADRGPVRARLRLARRWAQMADAGVVAVDGARAGAHHRLLRGAAAALPGRLDRRAGRQRHGQRPGRVGRPAAGAEPVAGARGGPARRRPAGRGRGDRRGRARTRASRSSPATPRWSSAATPTACTSAPPASAAATRARRWRPTALRPGDRVLLSGAIGEHGTAIMLARGEFELDAAIESDTRSLWPAVDALLEAAGPRPALHARRHPRRRGVGAERARPRRPVAMVVREGDVPVTPGGGRRGRDPRHRPDVRRQRGQAGRVRRPRGGRRGARGAALGAGLRAGGGDRRGADRAARAWCWWRRASAAAG